MKIPEQAQSWKKSLLDLTQANLVTGRTRFSLTTVVLKISIKSMKLEMSSILFLYVFDVLQCTLPPSRCWVYPRSKDMPSQHDAEMPDGYLNVWCKWRCKKLSNESTHIKNGGVHTFENLIFYNDTFKSQTQQSNSLQSTLNAIILLLSK